MLLIGIIRNIKMLVSKPGHNSASGSAVDKPKLQKIRLVYIFDGHAVFTSGGSQCVKPYRASTKAFYHGCYHIAVYRVQTDFVYLKTSERLVGNLSGDFAVI